MTTVGAVGLVGQVGLGSFVPRAFSGALDGVTATVAGASGFRRLRAAYTGPLVRVRRSSDNAEQDIGYLDDDSLDAATASAFIGGGTGFVATWYDQSGNARHWTQTSGPAQPALVLAAKPYLDYAGAQNLVGNIAMIAYGPAETWLATRIGATGQSVLRNNGNLASQNRYAVGGFRGVDFGDTTLQTASYTYGTDAVFGGYVNGTGVTTQGIVLNGADAGSGAVTRAGVGTVLWLGANPAPSDYLTGRIYEFVHFNSVLSAGDRSALYSAMVSAI